MRPLLFVLAAGFLAIPLAARADFTGDPIQTTYYFPDLNSPFANLGTFTAPFTLEIPGNQGHVIVTGDQISLVSDLSNTFNSAAFNGLVFTDENPSTVITGLTLDPSSTLFDAIGTFTSDSVAINLANLGQVSQGDFVTFDVSFASPASVTPEPTSFALLGTGLLGLGGVLRRKLA